MKKIIAFTFVFLFLSTPILAEETNSPTNVIRNQIREERQEAKTTITQVRQEKRSEISELKKQRLEVVYKAIRLGLTKKYEALFKTKANLDSRIAKRSLEGKDMTVAKEKLTEFDKLDSNYVSHLAAFDNKYVELSTSEKPSQLISGLRSSVELVKTDLKTMRQLFVEVTKLIITKK